MARKLELDRLSAVGDGTGCVLRPSDDPAVILASLRGDAAAFSRIVEDTWPFACGVVARLLRRRRDDFDVRSVVSDAFASLCGIVDGRTTFLIGFDPSRRSFRGFLHMVLTADVRDFWRRERLRASRAPAPADEATEDTCSEAGRRAVEARHDLAQIVGRMPPGYREALLLIDLHGASISDATRNLGRPTYAATNSLVERARSSARSIARALVERDL